MFNKLFRSRAVVQHHLSSPLLQERLEYLQHCANQGYSLTTLRELAADLLLIQNLLGLATSSDSLGLAAVQAGVNRWGHRRPQHFNYKNGRRGRVRVLSRAVRWLRFLGRLRLSGGAPPAYRSLLEPFFGCLQVEKELSEGTIHTRHCYVEDFLRGFFRDHNSLRQITITDIEEAMARKGRDDGYARLSIRAYPSSLRSFLRYAESRGWCTRGLAALVVSPRVYQHENLPVGPSWSDVQRLVATTKGSRPKDIRDRAILLLLTVYALRSGEVRALRLEDLDWEKAEIDALLAAPNLKSAQGQRDHLLLLFLYNTGARADEAAQVLVGDLNLAHVPRRDLSWVKIRGKGNKLRHCPLWPQTVNQLAAAIQGRVPAEHVFPNRYGRPITRFGVYDLATRYVRRAVRGMPSLATKKVSPHTIRRSTATHLLRGGVDINTVRDWLGHVSVDTTNIYARVDLETKAKAIVRCEPETTRAAKHWSECKGLMTFLRSL